MQARACLQQSTSRQAEGQTDKQTIKQIAREMDVQTDRHIDIQTGRPTDRRSDNITDTNRHRHRQSHRRRHRQSHSHSARQRARSQSHNAIQITNNNILARSVNGTETYKRASTEEVRQRFKEAKRSLSLRHVASALRPLPNAFLLRFGNPATTPTQHSNEGTSDK